MTGEAVLARYAYALDQHDPAALAGVLTEDAVWEFVIAGEVSPVTGRQAILDFVRDSTAGQTDQRRHHLTTVVVENTTAQAYLMLTSNAGGSPTVITTGFYTFTLERADDEWRIAKLVLVMDNAP